MEEAASGESSVLKAEEAAKQALLSGAKRIYSRQADINPLFVQQIISFLGRFEQLVGQQQIKTLTRVKLYELMEAVVALD